MQVRARYIAPFALALCAGPLTAQSAPAPSTVHFAVTGNSTIRSWECTVDGSVAATPASGATAAPGYANGVQTVTLKVPVREFECPEEEMTEHLLDALKPDRNAEITFEMQRYTVASNRATVQGNLTLGGVTKPVTVRGAITPAGQGFRFVGEVPLNMTEYGIEPPTVMMGMMKVRPNVRVKFDAVVPAAS